MPSDSKSDRIVFSADRIIKVITLTCFSIESVPLMFPIINRMKDKQNFNCYLISVSGAAFVVSSCLGCLVYRIMGSKISSIYLASMIQEFAVIKVLLALYAISLFLNYQYLLFPVYQIVVEERKMMKSLFSVSLGRRG